MICPLITASGARMLFGVTSPGPRSSSSARSMQVMIARGSVSTASDNAVMVCLGEENELGRDGAREEVFRLRRVEYDPGGVCGLCADDEDGRRFRLPSGDLTRAFQRGGKVNVLPFHRAQAAGADVGDSLWVSPVKECGGRNDDWIADGGLRTQGIPLSRR